MITFLEQTVFNSNILNSFTAAKSHVVYNKDQRNDTIPITGAKREVKQIGGSEQLMGLVALLGMYLRKGSKNGGSGNTLLNYAKLISSAFMARTDFGTMFFKLPYPDIKRFISDRLSFVTLVLDAAGLNGTENVKVFERGIRKSEDRNDPDYTVDLTNSVNELKITRKEWLLQITMGNDLISSSAMPHLSHIFMGLGVLGHRMDKVGKDLSPQSEKDKRSGIIVELRDMYKDKLPQEFASIAQDIFDYIVAMNNDKA